MAKRKAKPKGDVYRSEGGMFLGNVTAKKVVGRDEVVINRTDGVTLDEFLRLVAELRQGLPAAGLPAEATREAEASVRQIEAEAKSGQPSAERIAGALGSIRKVLAAATGLAAQGKKLLPLVEKAGEWAGYVFRD